MSLSLDSQKNTRRTVQKLILVCVGMFAFAVFVMPPFYDVACKWLGINGRGGVTGPVANTSVVDTGREVTVEFLANVYQDTPLDFSAPKPERITLHPGEVKQLTYLARNTSKQALWFQAVHSILPGEISRYVQLTECFCFKKQQFEPGITLELPIVLTVSPDLPPDEQRTFAVSYTFFKLQDMEGNAP